MPFIISHTFKMNARKTQINKEHFIYEVKFQAQNMFIYPRAIKDTNKTTDDTLTRTNPNT